MLHMLSRFSKSLTIFGNKVLSGLFDLGSKDISRSVVLTGSAAPSIGV